MATLAVLFIMRNTYLYPTSTTITISILLVLPGCGLRPRAKVLTRKIKIQDNQADNQAIGTTSTMQQQYITVFIHGTRIFPSVFHTVFKDKPGLKHAHELKETKRLYDIIYSITSADPYTYSEDNFYLFGWSGKLSFIARHEAAEILYHELDQLIQQYQDTYNCTPRIRLIAHSHGGNVALNLAHVWPTSSLVTIAELILLACPVQSRTMSFTAHPLFEKIYSLYSQLDIVQILDPQGLYQGESNGLFSHRLFPHNAKLAQVKVKRNGRALMHTEFIAPGFLHYVPRIIAEVEQWKEEHPDYYDQWVQMNKLLCLYTDGRDVNYEKYSLRNLELLQRT